MVIQQNNFQFQGGLGFFCDSLICENINCNFLTILVYCLLFTIIVVFCSYVQQLHEFYMNYENVMQSTLVKNYSSCSLYACQAYSFFTFFNLKNKFKISFFFLSFKDSAFTKLLTSNVARYSLMEKKSLLIQCFYCGLADFA